MTWFVEYNKSLAKYMMNMADGIGIDLTQVNELSFNVTNEWIRNLASLNKDDVLNDRWR